MGETTPMVRLLGDVRLSLGPVEYEVGGRHPRAFLAAIALDAGKVVAADRIGDLVWGADRLPRDERGALHQTATRVRRALRNAGWGDALRARPPGYVLDVATTEVDALQFRALVRSAREASREGDPPTAVHLLGEALALWRAPALQDVSSLPIAALGAVLDEERWAAEELRCGSLLELGEIDESIEHLRVATAVAPLREALWVLLIRGYATAGHHAEAASCASAAIAALSDGLGVRPGSELADLAARLRTDVPPAFVTIGHHRLATTDARRPMLDSALERALAAAEREARDASGRGAHHEAVRRWERVLEMSEVAAPADRARHLAVLLELGAAHNEASLDEEARRTFWRAAALARQLGDASSLARAALGYCADRITFRPPAETATLLEEALAALDRCDEPAVRSKLLSRLAIEVYWSGPLDHCRDLAAEAVAVAAHTDDTDAMLDAMNATGFGAWTPSRTTELVAAATEYVDAAVAAQSRAHEHLAHRWLAIAETELGHAESGRRHMEVSLRLADELPHPPYQWMARCVAAGHSILRGDLDEAERLASEALEIGSTVEPEVALDNVSLLIWTCRWLQGRLGEIAELVEAVASAPGIDLPRRLGLAMTKASIGRLDEAHALLDAVSVDELDSMPRDASWFSGMTALTETIAIVPHPHARWAAEQLAPFRDRIGFSPATVTGPMAHQLGVCWWAADRHEDGLVALREAVAMAEAIGAPIFAARGRMAIAERCESVGDHVEARKQAELAIAVSRELGLDGLTVAAHRVLGRVGPKPAPSD